MVRDGPMEEAPKHAPSGRDVPMERAPKLAPNVRDVPRATALKLAPNVREGRNAKNPKAENPRTSNLRRSPPKRPDTPGIKIDSLGIYSRNVPANAPGSVSSLRLTGPFLLTLRLVIFPLQAAPLQ